MQKRFTKMKGLRPTVYNKDSLANHVKFGQNVKEVDTFRSRCILLLFLVGMQIPSGGVRHKNVLVSPDPSRGQNEGPGRRTEGLF